MRWMGEGRKHAQQWVLRGARLGGSRSSEQNAPQMNKHEGKVAEQHKRINTPNRRSPQEQQSRRDPVPSRAVWEGVRNNTGHTPFEARFS